MSRIPHSPPPCCPSTKNLSNVVFYCLPHTVSCVLVTLNMLVVLMGLLEWDTLSCSSTSIIPRFNPVHSTVRIDSDSKLSSRPQGVNSEQMNMKPPYKTLFFINASHAPILLCRTPVPALVSPLPSTSSLDPPTASISHHCITIGRSR